MGLSSSDVMFSTAALRSARALKPLRHAPPAEPVSPRLPVPPAEPSAAGAKRPRAAEDAAPADAKAQRKRFRDTMREVLELGAGEFVGRDRKEWEAKQLERLGGKNTHKVKMPLPMFFNVMRARERREAHAEALARESQLVTGKKRATVKDQRKKQRHDERRRQLRKEPSIADERVRAGVMRVPKSLQRK